MISLKIRELYQKGLKLRTKMEYGQVNVYVSEKEKMPFKWNCQMMIA